MRLIPVFFSLIREFKGQLYSLCFLGDPWLPFAGSFLYETAFIKSYGLIKDFITIHLGVNSKSL